MYILLPNEFEDLILAFYILKSNKDEEEEEEIIYVSIFIFYHISIITTPTCINNPDMQ